MSPNRSAPQVDADWLVALFWAIPAVVLACFCLMLALAVSPLLVPYLAIRQFRGRDAANTFVWILLTLLVVLMCGYQVVAWVIDPVSFWASR